MYEAGMEEAEVVCLCRRSRAVSLDPRPVLLPIGAFLLQLVMLGSDSVLHKRRRDRTDT